MPSGKDYYANDARAVCGNPIVFAMKDGPAAFAAGVDIGAVVRFVVRAMDANKERRDHVEG